MINLAKLLKPFENEQCGGYRSYIYDDKEGEVCIEDIIEKAFKALGNNKYAITETYAFDNPGVYISILSVAYEDEDGTIKLETFELISC